MPARKPALSTAAVLIPERPSLKELGEISAGCQACDLYKRATQTVFGQGRSSAAIMLVGEQPGNDEDLAGKPFVGPAGKLLDKALLEAGIDRDAVYVTNVVKHFKWEPRGKRRIHAKPNANEVRACMPWLQAEVRLVKPQVLVCLGATAAQALLGRQFRVTERRGQLIPSEIASKVIATIHPSAILRAPDDETRRLETKRFIEDMRVAAAVIS